MSKYTYDGYLNVHNELVMWYLNYDNINISDKEIYDYSKLYNIPYQIFLKKLLERFVSLKQCDADNILDIMKNKMNLEISEEAKKYLLDLIPLISPIKLINRAEAKPEDLIKTLGFFNKLTIITKEKPTHTGQPLPDPVFGRPYIDWKRCYHENCHEQFPDDNCLIRHLKSFKVYTRNYHKLHEDMIKDLKLTEEKILSENIKKCPSLLCNETGITTPEDLIKHFQRLGLEPFWKKGMKFKKKSDYVFNPEFKIFNVDECVICCEAKPNIILDNCLHCCFCVECYVQYIKYNYVTKCPVCRETYNKVYPY